MVPLTRSMAGRDLPGPNLCRYGVESGRPIPGAGAAADVDAIPDGKVTDQYSNPLGNTHTHRDVLSDPVTDTLRHPLADGDHEALKDRPSSFPRRFGPIAPREGRGLLDEGSQPTPASTGRRKDARHARTCGEYGSGDFSLGGVISPGNQGCQAGVVQQQGQVRTQGGSVGQLDQPLEQEGGQLLPPDLLGAAFLARLLDGPLDFLPVDRLGFGQRLADQNGTLHSDLPV